MSSSEKTSSTSRPRKRGRPAHLSREQIVEAALRLLREAPDKALTMQALARELNAAPMSLYTHIRNREDLMKAIAEDVLSNVQVEVADHWRDTVANWARALRVRFLQYPFVAALLQDGIATPAAWLTVSNPLLQALKQAGFSAEELADTQRWISRVVTGSVLMELVLPKVVPEELIGVRRALDALPPESQATWLEILPALGQRNDEEVFEYTLARTLDAVETLRQSRPGG